MRPSNGMRLLSGLCNSRNISNNDSLSLIYTGGWRLGDCGFNKHSLGSRGISEVEATYPSLVLSVRFFWIDSI